MSLKEKIEQDFLVAYKAKETVKTAVLRQLKTAATVREKEVLRPLTDPEYLDLIAKQVKQRRESVEQFTKGGRPDLVAIEERELVVLLTYLPAAFSDQELLAVIDQAMAETGAAGPKDMGRVMKLVMDRAKGQADGKKISEFVKTRLGA